MNVFTHPETRLRRSILAGIALMFLHAGEAQGQIFGPFRGVDWATSHCEIVAIVHIDAEALFWQGRWQRKDDLIARDGYNPMFGTTSSFYCEFFCTTLQTIKGTTATLGSAPLSLCRLPSARDFGRLGKGSLEYKRMTPFDHDLEAWLEKQTEPAWPPIPIGADALVFLTTKMNPTRPPESLNAPGSTILLPPEVAHAVIPAGTPRARIQWLLHKLIDDKAGEAPGSP